MKIIRFLSISCKESTQLSTKKLEQKLSWRENILLQCHVLICTPCRYFQQQVNAIHTSIRNMITNDKILNTRLSEEKKINMQAALNKAQSELTSNKN
jgi:actin-like ATPase involved in cell morphogenesis